MASWRTFEHPYYDIRVCVDTEDGQACIEFGADLRRRMEASDDWGGLDDIPVDGEVIRAAGRLYTVGQMDTSAPPLLHLRPTDEEPDGGLWWDADEDDSLGRWCVRNRNGLYLNSIGLWTVDWDLAARFFTVEEAEDKAAANGGGVEEWRDCSEDEE